jgi:hypothetical protein
MSSARLYSAAEVIGHAADLYCDSAGAEHDSERGRITHRFLLEDYGKALNALTSDRTSHKVVIITI